MLRVLGKIHREVKSETFIQLSNSRAKRIQSRKLPSANMSSQQVSQKQSHDADKSQSSAYQTTKETVSSVAANLSGAFNISGGASANAGSYKSTTTTMNGNDKKLSKEEADHLYEERMEDEYAKREGGA